MRLTIPALLFLILAAQSASAGGYASLRDAVPGSTTPAERSFAWDAGDETAGDNVRPISPAKAILYSLLLPGLGDYKLGNKGRATAFFAAEGVIWISYAAFDSQGHQRENDYQDLAVRFAGVSRTGHSDDFYAKVREFNNSDDYEADVKLSGREAATGVPDLSANALETYFVDNRVSDFEPWRWQSLDKRLQYSEVRSSSKTSYRRADYMLAAAVANRVVSAIVAYSAARSMEPKTVGYHFDFTPTARGVDVSLALTRSF